jgi:hypothetical protein
VEVRLAKFDLKELARRGAEARVAELTAELAAIHRAFPGLRVRRGDGVAAPAAKARRRRRRKPMTSEQKKAVSVRMKKYWAARRKAKAGD